MLKYNRHDSKVRTLKCTNHAALFKFSYHKLFDADLSSDFYSIKFLRTGKETYDIEDRKTSLNDNQLIITKPHEAIKVKVKTVDLSTGICIYIHSDFLKNYFRDQTGHKYLPKFKLSLQETSLLSFYKICGFNSNPDAMISQFIKLFDQHVSTRIKQTNQLQGNNWETKMNLWSRIELSRDYILKNYYKPLKLQDVADHACLSPFYFQRSFKQFFGISPNNYLRNYRMNQAQKFYQEGLTTPEVALRCGYDDIKYFRKIYNGLPS